MTELGINQLNHVVLQRSIMLNCWEMVAGYRSHKHSDIYCLKGEVESVNDGELMNVISINNVAAQQMIDSMWSGGLRPSTGVSSTGQVEALNGEIIHLRTLVTRIVNAEWSEKNVPTS